MPQLNIETFVTQYFWLIVVLFGFYIVVVTAIIPSIASAIKLRKKLTMTEATQGSEASATAESSATGFNISVPYEVYTPVDLKSLYFSNNDWIKSNLK
jgi:hypothetical protein